METGTATVISLPVVPPGLPPDLREYLNHVGQLVVGLKQQVTQLLVQQVGGPDGSLSRSQAMALLNVRHAKFNLIRGELTQAPSSGYPRYTYASCREWLYTHRHPALSRADVERLIEQRLNDLAKRPAK